MSIIRLLDIFLASVGLILLAPLLLFVIFFAFLDTGTPIFKQTRVGRNKKPFVLIKIRTMDAKTVSVATHLLTGNSVTKFGSLLRQTKLDELPQLWNVVKGDMSLVGPRPGLFNQEDLISARDKKNVFDVRPGITGLAQIKNIDMSTPILLAETDAVLIKELSVASYFKYIWLTIIARGGSNFTKE